MRSVAVARMGLHRLPSRIEHALCSTVIPRAGVERIRIVICSSSIRFRKWARRISFSDPLAGAGTMPKSLSIKGEVVAEPLIFVNTYAIKGGQLDAYKAEVPSWLEFLETNHPRMLHFGAYINEAGTEVTIVQVHPDAESMDLQLKVIEGDVQKWAQYIEWNDMSILVCGSPSEATQEAMRQTAGSGVPVSVKTPLGGFSRLSPT